MSQDRLLDGIPEFLAALRLKPDLYMARMNYARTLAGLGREREALAQMEEALAGNPRDAGARQEMEALRARIQSGTR